MRNDKVKFSWRKEKIKKLFVLGLAGALVLSLAGCNKAVKEASSEVVADVNSEITGAVEEITSDITSEINSEIEEVVDYPDFTGTYTEPLAGRCTIEIEHTDGDNHTVLVHWASSAAESANWEINAVYYPSTGLLEYTGAKYYIRTYTDEENYTDDVKYTDGEGEFWFEEDGTLGWRSTKSAIDGIDGTTFFERVPENE
ncbi:MAG: hypothetical protein IKI20_03160 [Lachnospiraceae bacterium]|nr:hypothetical protein [Lachnospiraceae bacterium]